MVRAVDIHIQVRCQDASLVEDEVRDGQRAQRIANGPRVHVKALAAACLRREHARNRYRDHAATSTDRIGGRCRTASTHVSPLVRAKKEPLWVPKYTDSASEAEPSRSTVAQAGSGSPSAIGCHVSPRSRVRYTASRPPGL